MRFRVALLSALAFLFAGIANVHAHVHLCLDGSEPPAAMHIDGNDHLGHHAEDADSHQDVDVDVPAEIVAKTLKTDLPAVVPALLRDVVLPAAVEAGVAPESLQHFIPASLPYLRPPMRGPPQLISRR